MIFNNYIRHKFVNIMIYVHFFYAFVSCNPAISPKKSEEKSDPIAENITVKDISITNCPSEGTCSIRFYKKKSIVLKTVNNHLFYTIVSNNSKMVVEFQYSSKQDEVAIDGGYRESVIFEISNNSSKIDFKDLDLQKTKMVYSRKCNCRGKAGIFKIDKGNLKLYSNLGKINFSLKFTLDKNPPLINEIYVQNNILK